MFLNYKFQGPNNVTELPREHRRASGVKPWFLVLEIRNLEEKLHSKVLLTPLFMVLCQSLFKFF